MKNKLKKLKNVIGVLTLSTAVATSCAPNVLDHVAKADTIDYSEMTMSYKFSMNSMTYYNTSGGNIYVALESQNSTLNVTTSNGFWTINSIVFGGTLSLLNYNVHIKASNSISFVVPINYEVGVITQQTLGNLEIYASVDNGNNLKNVSSYKYNVDIKGQSRVYQNTESTELYNNFYDYDVVMGDSNFGLKWCLSLENIRAYVDNYQRGYNNGVTEVTENPSEYDLATEEEVETAYNNGYRAGQNDTFENNGFMFLLQSVFSAPVSMFREAFNFEIFGINVANLVALLLTIGLVILVVGIFKGKGT